MGAEGVVTFISQLSCNTSDSNYIALFLSPHSDGYISGEFILVQQKLTRKGKLGKGIETTRFWYSVPENSFFSLAWWFFKTAALKVAKQHRELPRLWTEDLSHAAARWLPVRYTALVKTAQDWKVAVKTWSKEVYRLWFLCLISQICDEVAESKQRSPSCKFWCEKFDLWRNGSPECVSVIVRVCGNMIFRSRFLTVFSPFISTLLRFVPWGFYIDNQ